MRPARGFYPLSYLRFQSTHSLRSATGFPGTPGFLVPVSIHALLAECDCIPSMGQRTSTSFNPRTPCGVRLPQMTISAELETVSIHALLAECDRSALYCHLSYGGFNPRTPCGVRLISSFGTLPLLSFQSTHSLRSATSPVSPVSPVSPGSIHALLAEGD